MPLTVYSCVSYSPIFGDRRTEEAWAALHFVNAIKGTPLAGYANLPLPSGGVVRIDRPAATSAPQWFALCAVNALAWRDFLPCGLVPVPDATCDLKADRRSNTYRLADELACALGPEAAIVDVLRWIRPMARAHSADGSRDPQVLYGRLRLRDRSWPLARQRLVLVDDVVASGAHLRAAAAFLTDWGAAVLCAICAAGCSETLSGNENALTASAHVLPNFHSDPDWLLPEIYDGVEL
jgi:hypothetical protein